MDMRVIIAERIDKLQKLDIATLQSLPPHSQETLLSEVKIAISQYHEISDAGEHKVIVQAIRPKWLGLSTAIEVDGFVCSSDGTRRPLSEKEKWAYL